MEPRSERSGIFTAVVTRRRAPCREHFELTLAVDHFPAAEPGQFIQILCHEAEVEACGTSDGVATGTVVPGPMLRRPFSIGGLRREGERCEIDILGRVVGRGTAWLSDLSIEDPVNILGPLGQPFQMPKWNECALLVAGGVGLPPLRWLGISLARRQIPCRAIVGAQTADLLPVSIRVAPSADSEFTDCIDEFAGHGIASIITTDDGTMGVRGRVTTALNAVLRQDVDGPSYHVYSCGPEAMLKAVASLCAERNVPCHLALERVMGCGMGTCQSCVVKVQDDRAPDSWRYALCCREGPVFDARELIW